MGKRIIKDLTEVYGLKPGNVYLIEYKVRAIPRDMIIGAAQGLQKMGIYVYFIPNYDDTIGLHAVPAVPKDNNADRSGL